LMLFHCCFRIDRMFPAWFPLVSLRSLPPSS